MNRAPGKKLVQTASKFETLAKLVTKACDPDKPTLVKSLTNKRDNLDDNFIELCHDHKLYKNDATFNEKNVDGDDKFPYNDTWLEAIEEKYCELVDKSDDKLEELAKAADKSVQETKPDMTAVKEAEELKVRSLLESQIISEKKSITDSITLTSNSVSAMPNKSISTSQRQAIRGSLHDVTARMDGRLQNLSEQFLRLLSEPQLTTFQTEFRNK